MKDMIRTAIEELFEEEIQSLVSELYYAKVKEAVEDWYIGHNLKSYVEDKINEMDIDTDLIEETIDEAIEASTYELF